MPSSHISCAVDGCNKTIYRRQWCKSHYRFWQLYGDPLRKSTKFDKKPCSIDGCQEIAKGKGFCKAHLYAYNYYGDPLYVNVRPVYEACLVQGCPRLPYKRGYCNAHYIRLRRHGDPQGGLPTENGEPERYLREVILPFDHDSCIFWPYGLTAGYGSVYIDGKFHYVHRFVCEHAWGPSPDPRFQAAHKCGIKSCCSKRHLRWATPKANSLDKIEHKTMRSKLTSDQVKEIRLLKGKLGHRKLAKRYGVTRNAIKCIFDGKTWAWLTD